MDSFLTTIVTKYVETKQNLSKPRTDALIHFIYEYAQTNQLEIITNRIQYLQIDFLPYSDESKQFLRHVVSTKFKDILVISGYNINLFMIGGHIQYVIYLYDQFKPDMLSFSLKLYFDSIDTQALKSIFSYQLIEYLQHNILSDNSKTTQNSKNPTFKNKHKDILKFKLNYYMDQVQSMIQEVPKNVIEDIINKFTQYNPVFSGPTAMLMAIHNGIYYAIQYPDHTNDNKYQMTLFISCFNIPKLLCKMYQIGNYSVYVTKIKGAAKLFHSKQYDPLVQILDPIHALRASYISIQSPYQKLLLFAICLTARIKLFKKNNVGTHTIYYSKKNYYLPNIQSGIDQLISFITFYLQSQTQHQKTVYNQQSGTGVIQQSPPYLSNLAMITQLDWNLDQSLAS